MSEFNDKGIEVAAISVDSHFSHKAWLETPRKKGGVEGCGYPLLSDLTKRTATDYGVLMEGPGIALRGLFIIDPKGIVQHTQVNNLPVGRSVTETLRLVQAFQFNQENSGLECPIDWTPGSEPLEVAKAGEFFEKHG